MKFVPSRDLRLRPGQVWKDLQAERELIVTSHGKPVALMVPLGDEDVEQTLRAVRRARAQEAVRAVRELHAQAGEGPGEAEIEREIRQVRRGRR